MIWLMEKLLRKILTDIYTSLLAEKAKDFIGIIPEITLFEFLDAVRNAEYGGQEEFQEIRSRLPEEIIQNDLITGVLGSHEEIAEVISEEETSEEQSE